MHSRPLGVAFGIHTQRSYSAGVARAATAFNGLLVPMFLRTGACPCRAGMSCDQLGATTITSNFNALIP